MATLRSACSVLVVEDNDALREIVASFLKEQGLKTKGVDCAEELDRQFSKSIFDIVILDLNLPGEDGLSIAQRLRKSHPKVGIIMFTARTSMEDKVKGYESGADIYLTKPVSNQELLAAINSLNRRITTQVSPRKGRGKLVFYAAEKKLSGPDGSCVVNDADTMILNALSTSKNQMVEYWELLELLNLTQSENAKGTLEVKIVRLRKKIEAVGGSTEAIKSLRNKGYQLTITLTHN
jgi:DNA-binding response OmpR family regulator